MHTDEGFKNSDNISKCLCFSQQKKLSVYSIRTSIKDVEVNVFSTKKDSDLSFSHQRFLIDQGTSLESVLISLNLL